MEEVDKEVAGQARGSRNLLAKHLRLGETLRITDRPGKHQDFEDLDEIIHSYIDPLTENILQTIRHRKFQKGSREEVDQYLRSEADANPGITVYAFSMDLENVGKAMLTYVSPTLKRTPHHLPIVPTPKGFEFQKHKFKDLEDLSAFFKTYWYFIHNRKDIPMSKK